MYIRRKVFSLLEIEGEERLFSTTDINLEDAEERIFNERDDNKTAEKAEKIGKVAAIGGGAGYLVSSGAQDAMKISAIKKTAQKYLDKALKNPENGVDPELNKRFERVIRLVKSKKSYKNLQKAKKLGLATAIAGGALYGGSKLLKNKKED